MNNANRLHSDRGYARCRRVVDLTLALLLLPLAFPLACAVAAVIQIISPGPVLFRQLRTGYRCRPFVMIKLRTMAPSGRRLSDGSEEQTSKQDARVSGIARWIRCHRLDELPQLWHVITGEMALIGPRPIPYGVAEQRIAAIPEFPERGRVRPGLTGLAQVRLGYVSELEIERHRVALDLAYIEQMSPALDAEILIATVRTVVRGLGGR